MVATEGADLAGGDRRVRRIGARPQAVLLAPLPVIPAIAVAAVQMTVTASPLKELFAFAVTPNLLKSGCGSTTAWLQYEGHGLFQRTLCASVAATASTNIA